MEAKCNLCEVFGEKIHCHNCKIFNNAREHAPQEITCSLEEFVRSGNDFRIALTGRRVFDDGLDMSL